MSTEPKAAGKISRQAEYQRDYYQQNKEKKASQQMERYHRRRSTEEGLAESRKYARESMRKYRETHPEKTKAARKRAYDSRRRRALEIVSGEAKCVRCGCDMLDVLEVNHINGNGSKEARESTANLYDRILKGERATDDLEVLCRVCNALDYVERKCPEAIGRHRVIWDNSPKGGRK